MITLRPLSDVVREVYSRPRSVFTSIAVDYPLVCPACGDFAVSHDENNDTWCPTCDFETDCHRLCGAPAMPMPDLEINP